MMRDDTVDGQPPNSLGSEGTTLHAEFSEWEQNSPHGASQVGGQRLRAWYFEPHPVQVGWIASGNFRKRIGTELSRLTAWESLLRMGVGTRSILAAS